MFRGGTFKEMLFNISAVLRKDLEEKKTELEEYTNVTVIEDAKSTVDDYITNTSKPDLENYTTTKEGEIETLATTKKSEITSHTDNKIGEITTHTDTKKAEITSHTDDKIGEITTHTDTKIEEVTSHTETKKTELDSYEQEKECELETYTTEKKAEIDTYKDFKVSEFLDETEALTTSKLTDDYTGDSSSLVASQKALSDGLSTTFKISDCYYGVGDYWITESTTNPATKWVGTTWEKVEGRMLFGADDSTYIVGAEGGVTDVTLTTDNMPSHRHQVDSHTHTQASHKHTISTHYGSGASGVSSFTSGNTGTRTYSTNSAGGDNTGSSTPYTDYQGGGSAFSILNSYRAVNIWRRTA